MRNAALAFVFVVASLPALAQQEFEKGLKAKEFEVRLATVQLLARDKDPKTEKLLVGALKDDDWEVVLRATQALGERGTKASFDVLVKLALDAPLQRVRQAAAMALARVAPDEAVAELMRKTQPESTAFAACDALAFVCANRDTKNDLHPLVKLVERSKDSAVRAAAARVLAAATWKDRETVLAKLEDSGTVRVVCAVLDECAKAPRPGDLERALKLLQAQKLDDCVERRALKTARAAIEAGGSALDEAQTLGQLSPLLGAKDPLVAARGARLVSSLTGTPASKDKTAVGGRVSVSAALTALKPVLEHADAPARKAAAAALSRISGDGALARARSMAQDDKSPRVRYVALETLAQIAAISEEPNRVVALHALANDTDPDVRRLAAVLLGQKGLDEAVAPLVGALADKDWGVAVCAAVSLGKTQSGSAIEPLAKLSKASADWKLRAAAAVGLSRMYLKSAIPPMIAALNDPDPFVVTTVHATLVAVAREKIAPKVELWNEWWAKHADTITIVNPATQAEYQKRFGDRSTGAPEIFRDLDVVVLESRGDHIENVLKDQKIEFRTTMASKIGANGISVDGLFVANCTGEIEEGDVERLRWFVLTGGHLLGSCWALHETIERALPGVQRKFETTSEVVANVEAFDCSNRSPYLEGVFTEGVRPIYALEGAHLIEVVDAERNEVLLDSPECAERFGCGNLAAWFVAGHGTVLDSVNHFEAQGLESAVGLKSAQDRQAFAVDHMGLALDRLRVVKGEKWWDSALKASKEITDLSVFRLVTNFVRLRRLRL